MEGHVTWRQRDPWRQWRQWGRGFPVMAAVATVGEGVSGDFNLGWTTIVNLDVLRYHYSIFGLKRNHLATLVCSLLSVLLPTIHLKSTFEHVKNNFRAHFISRTGWPDVFAKKNHPKFYPNPFLSHLLHNFPCGKSSRKIWTTFLIKKLPKRKKSPNWWKIAQSGLPDLNLLDQTNDLNSGWTKDEM
jgi:hypothetical protein